MKKLLSVLLALLCVVSFVGCTPKEEDPSEPVTVTIWSQYSDHQREMLDEVVAAYNASQTKYVVVVEKQDKDYLKNIPQAVAAKAGPDFVIEYGSYAASYHEDDLVVNLDNYLSQKAKDNLIDSADAYAHGFDDGGMYLYPLIGTGGVLWYNPEIFELAGVEVPTTWDELFAAAKTIHEKVTVVNSESGMKFVTDGSGEPIYGWTAEGDETLREIAMQYGGYFDIETGECLFNNEKVAAWLKKFQQACNDGYISAVYQQGYANQDMNAGILACGTGSVAGRGYYTCKVESAPLPQLGEEGAVVSTCARSRGAIIFDNGDENRIKGAVDFLEFFSSAEQNFKHVKALNYFAVLQDTIDYEPYQEWVKDVKEFADVKAEYGSYYESVGITTYVQEAMKNVIANVGAQMDVQEALDAAVAFVNSNK